MSGDRYLIRDQRAVYFLTITVIDWIGVFSRKEYKIIIVDSLNYCIENKGLTVFAWVVMSNHIHLVVKANDGYELSSIIRDFKKFTAKSIISAIKEIGESRRVWMLNKMEFAGRRLKRIKKYKFWKDANHAIELTDNYLTDQKINYIHENPVKAMIVAQAEHYLFSSALDYAGEKGFVKVELMK